MKYLSTYKIFESSEGIVDAKKVKEILTRNGWIEGVDWFKEGKNFYGDGRQDAYGFYDKSVESKLSSTGNYSGDLDIFLKSIGLVPINIWVGSAVYGYTHRLVRVASIVESTGYEDPITFTINSIWHHVLNEFGIDTSGKVYKDFRDLDAERRFEDIIACLAHNYLKFECVQKVTWNGPSNFVDPHPARITKMINCSLIHSGESSDMKIKYQFGGKTDYLPWVTIKFNNKLKMYHMIRPSGQITVDNPSEELKRAIKSISFKKAQSRFDL